jgi:pyruvate dehydrogenase E2 component (dihydrolipoyllysine-residue acetyltransferase)
MATEVVMPQMGESIAEGTITKWLVKIGDKVERDQPLFEISTDKVDAEIPSPAAGVLIEIRNQEGETVPVNQIVAVIGEAGEAAGAAAPAAVAASAPSAGASAPAAAAAAAPAPPAGAAAPAAPAAASAPAAGAAGKPASPSAPAPAPASAPAPSPQPAAAAPEKQAAPGAETAAREEISREGAAAGAGASGPRRVPSTVAPVPPAAAGAAAAQESQEVRRDEGESDLARESDREELSEGERLRRFSSPLVRSIAAKEGVDLQEVAGTGAQGRVTKGDILSFLEQRRTAPARPAAVPAPPAAAAAPQPLRPTGGFYVPAYFEGEDVEIEPMSKIRQITAAHMVYSKATSAHVTTVFDFDMSRVARIRARAKDNFVRKEGTKLTFMPFIFKAVVNGLKAHRKLNASIDGTNIVYKKNINLGMAVDLGHGLIVPVIKHADHLNLIGLAKAANDLAERARGKKLKPEEVQGGTFTITNPGVFGSLFGTPIINQPQVAILGVGAIEKRPVVVEDADGNDSLSIRTRCYFGITYDHRLVDGADADRFMVDLKKTLETDTWTELEPYV